MNRRNRLVRMYFEKWLETGEMPSIWFFNSRPKAREVWEKLKKRYEWKKLRASKANENRK